MDVCVLFAYRSIDARAHQHKRITIPRHTYSLRYLFCLALLVLACLFPEACVFVLVCSAEAGASTVVLVCLPPAKPALWRLLGSGLTAVRSADRSASNRLDRQKLATTASSNPLLTCKTPLVLSWHNWHLFISLLVHMTSIAKISYCKTISVIFYFTSVLYCRRFSSISIAFLSNL